MYRLVLLFVTVAACGQSFDRATSVKDTRVLDIQADPPELVADPGALLALAQGLSYEDVEAQGFTVVRSAPVTFRALVVDPRGAPVDYEWRFCDRENRSGCYRPLEVEGVDVETLVGAHGGSTVPDKTGTVPVPEDTRDIPMAVFWELFQRDSLLGMQGVFPSAVLEVWGIEIHEIAQKRIVLSLPDLALQLAAGQAGVVLCDDPDVPEVPAGCVPLRPRVPNTNPVLSEVRFRRGNFEHQDQPFEPLPAEPLEVAPGEEVRFLPVFADGSSEPYQKVTFDVNTLHLRVEDTQEKLSVSWLATAGEVHEAITWELLTVTLDALWTAPSEPPEQPDGILYIWLIGRDQRGGTTWARIDLRVVP